jgi:hypothetical protein
MQPENSSGDSRSTTSPRKRFTKIARRAKEDYRAQNECIKDVGKSLLRAVPVTGDITGSVRIDKCEQEENLPLAAERAGRAAEPVASPEVLAHFKHAESPEFGTDRRLRVVARFGQCQSITSCLHFQSTLCLASTARTDKVMIDCGQIVIDRGDSLDVDPASQLRNRLNGQKKLIRAGRLNKESLAHLEGAAPRRYEVRREAVWRDHAAG